MQHALFETALGPLVIAWSERGIRRVQSKNAAPALVRALERSAEPSRPPWVEEAIAKIQRHLEGAPQDLSRMPLDMDGLPTFHRRVYELAREVPPGETASYGELASRAGNPAAARAVGQALAANPFLLLVPCHRVVASGGKPGGFSFEGGIDTKAKILALEGVATEAWGLRNAQLSLFSGDHVESAPARSTVR